MVGSRPRAFIDRNRNLPAPEGRLAGDGGTTPRSGKSRRGASALAVIVFAAIDVIAFGAGTVPEALAAVPQSWTLTVRGLRTSPGNVPIGDITIRNALVTSTDNTLGRFDLSIAVSPPSGPCQQSGFTARFVGTMTSIVSFTVSSSDLCTGGFPAVPFVAPLNPAAFPNATSFSGGAPQFGVTVEGTCNSGCGQAPIDQAKAGVSQAAALGNIALTTTSVQTTNVGLRLAALRRGAMGVNVSGVAFNVDGQSVPLGAVTNLLSSQERSGGASADRSSLLARLGIFANGQGSFGNQDATSRDPGFDFHTGGLTVGADYRLTDQLVLGMALGYLRTKAEFDASAGASRINGYSLSAYGNYYVWDRLYIDGIATFGWNTYDTERNIAAAGATASGRTDGTQFAISASTGYNVDVGALTVGPTARVNYVHVHIDGFRERGADIFNLNLASQTVESLTTALGGQASYAISIPWGVLTPLVRFEWEHEFKGNSRVVTASLVADPTTVVGALTGSPDRDYVNLGVGLSATFPRGVSAFVAYDTVRGRAHFTNDSFNAGIRFAF